MRKSASVLERNLNINTSLSMMEFEIPEMNVICLFLPNEEGELRDWCWSSSILVTWCEQLTHWKSHWCWERLSAEGEEDIRGWDGWIGCNEGKLRYTLGDGEGQGGLVLHAVHGVTKSWTWLGDWTATTMIAYY